MDGPTPSHDSHSPPSSASCNPFRKEGAVKFLQKTFDLILQKALQEGCDPDTKVVEFKHPRELKSLLDLDLTSNPCNDEHLLEELKKIVQYSVKTGHPHYYNQLYGGLDPYSQAGAWLTDATNTNIHTYEVCPVQIVIEQCLVDKICGIIGYEHGDGLFLPGGSASNQFAMNLARFLKCPEFKTAGLYGLHRMRIYTSEDGHYSVKKGAAYLGFGTDNVVSVKTNDDGQMDVKDLRLKIVEDKEKGYLPLFVNTTGGTTVIGSYDPLVSISDVCKEFDLWLHCDACWGGAALLSPTHRYLLEGSELCDSFAWNFHKLSGIPLQCSGLFVKQKGLMEKTYKGNAEYLFQPDKFYDTSYDIGDKTIQCGRKPDGLKLWLQWKALGDDGMRHRVDTAFSNARYLAEKMKQSKSFKLVSEKVYCTNVCFWYIPPRLQDLHQTEEWWQQIKLVAPKIKERMVLSGSLMIGFQPLTSRGFVNFFRIVIMNPMNTHKDMDFVMEEIERCGHDL